MKDKHSSRTTAMAKRQLKSMVLSYPDWEADYEEAQEVLKNGKIWRFERLIQKLQKKQVVHEGDRSHPQLKALDELVLTYPGYHKDIRHLESIHFEFDGKVFWDKLEGLRHRQRSFLKDRSHPNLFNLDSLFITYPGWKQDFARAEDAHYDGNQRRFERLLYKLEKKQCVHEGDRSHPQLAALDELVLSYPGWVDDVHDAELIHYEYEGKVFWDKLEGLRSKQQIYAGDRSHPNLVKLDSLHLTYHGWEIDYQKAVNAHVSGNNWRFQRLVEQISKKESSGRSENSYCEKQQKDENSQVSRRQKSCDREATKKLRRRQTRSKKNEYIARSA